jgi:hypothetical protein
MLPELHDALRRLLYEDGRIAPDEVDIRFEAPTREQIERLTRPTISLFLVALQENTDLRRGSYETRRANGHAERRAAPRRIDLRYLVSALTTAIDDEHRLLWRVLLTLLRHPELPEELLPPALRGLDPPLSARVAQPDDGLRAFDVWNALGVPPRPALVYTVTAPLDLDISFSAPLVLTRTVRYLRAGDDTPNVVRHHIGGVVRDKTGAPIPNATVTVDDSAQTTLSDARGEFRLADVPEGVVKLRVSVDGREREAELDVPGDGYVVEV